MLNEGKMGYKIEYIGVHHAWVGNIQKNIQSQNAISSQETKKGIAEKTLTA